MNEPGEVLRCSFCNKQEREVRKLVAGPAVYICDDCVDICLGILEESSKDDPARPLIPSEAAEGPPPQLFLYASSCSLCHMPVPLEHALPVRNRGMICPGCVGAIEAAAAANRVATSM
jgi:hypothetical protein